MWINEPPETTNDIEKRAWRFLNFSVRMLNSPLFTSSMRGFCEHNTSTLLLVKSLNSHSEQRRRRTNDRRALTMTWNWQSNRRRVKEHNRRRRRATAHTNWMSSIVRPRWTCCEAILCFWKMTSLLVVFIFFIVSEVFIVSLQWSPRDVAFMEVIANGWRGEARENKRFSARREVENILLFLLNWHNIEWSWKWSPLQKNVSPNIAANVNSNNRHTNDATDEITTDMAWELENVLEFYLPSSSLCRLDWVHRAHEAHHQTVQVQASRRLKRIAVLSSYLLNSFVSLNQQCDIISAPFANSSHDKHFIWEPFFISFSLSHTIDIHLVLRLGVSLGRRKRDMHREL